MLRLTRSYKSKCFICKNITSIGKKNIENVMCICCQIKLLNKRNQILNIDSN
jgi:hypothetical protein